MPINTKVAEVQWQRYTFMRDTGHMQYVDKSNRCNNFVLGEQWQEEDMRELREARRPALTINKTLGTLASIVGEQIDLRTEIAFKARYGAPSGNADTLTKVFRFISDKNQLPWVRTNMFIDGGITSRGFVDIRMNFDHSITGDVQISSINPKNVIIDPDSDEYDPDKWNDVIVTKWMTADDIEYLYNKKDADALRTRTSSSWTYGYDSIDRQRDRFGGQGIIGSYTTEDMQGVSRMIRVIDRQYRKLDKIVYAVNVMTGDRKEIPKSWDRNKIAQFAEQAQGRYQVIDSVGHRVRWTVTADEFVLHDDWSPYKHFTVVPYFPYFIYGRTSGFVEHLLSPQELLNKTTSQELHVINTTANSGWMTKVGNIKNLTPDELEQWGSKTGLVLEVDDISQTEKITPNQIPSGLDRLSVKSEGYIKSVSGRGDAQMGMARADVSADQIEAQTQNGNQGLRWSLDNLRRTDWIIARNVLDLVQEFYTDPRIMNITHNDLTGEQTEVKINWPDPATGEIQGDISMGEYDFVVTAQQERQTLEQTQFDQAVYLREKLGVKIPDEFLIENSNLINKTGMVAALKQAAQSPAAQLQEQNAVLQQQLGTAELKAKTSKEEADALLKRAKAAKEMANVQEIANGDPTAEKEMELKQRQHDQEMEHDRQKHSQEMQMEREKHQLEQQTKANAAKDEQYLARAKGVLALKQQAANPQGQAGQTIKKDV